MKILGSFVFIWGTGLALSIAFNYWTWILLRRIPLENLSNTGERAFVEDHGHGFFILIFLAGIITAIGGAKLFRLQRKSRSVAGQ